MGLAPQAVSLIELLGVVLPLLLVVLLVVLVAVLVVMLGDKSNHRCVSNQLCVLQ